MFERRRRPILGAAVVVGASRVAARHEVQQQELVEAQRENEIQREVELQRSREEEQELRTQRAVDEAMKKAARENQAAQRSAAEVLSPPLPQYYNTYPSMPVQTGDMGFYKPAAIAGPSVQPVPADPLRSQSQEGRLQRAPDIGSIGLASRSQTQYCAQCGFACQVGDRFCRQCGTKQVYQERLEKMI
ncbi:uncharacterized protein B0J16DRAFT_312609 [Fusarium flagelliforme]|uniref:Zinc ribbon domain-containing protein n=1 Tax=Fusarium flagelliforme TaxID=2675880 RepID=A0A395MBF6_9HYPO|nr:uncharacterized protein B0J16DRAFT_312609 [Fusarium flagelliforme]KAH7169679.1 hypothetical protein B0J16DRAFT_312609 [Fusarium flagelliforme]RFN45156.1 hypothetical protein FIE12Z_10599 [Fusarium flagelliforme]